MNETADGGRRYRLALAGEAPDLAPAVTTYNGLWGAISEARERLREHPDAGFVTIYRAGETAAVMNVWRED